MSSWEVTETLPWDLCVHCTHKVELWAAAACPEQLVSHLKSKWGTTKLQRESFVSESTEKETAREQSNLRVKPDVALSPSLVLMGLTFLWQHGGTDVGGECSWCRANGRCFPCQLTTARELNTGQDCGGGKKKLGDVIFFKEKLNLSTLMTGF